MTTQPDPHGTTHTTTQTTTPGTLPKTHRDPVPHPVPTLSREGSPGTAETTLSLVPSPYGRDRVDEPPATLSRTRSNTLSRPPSGRWLVTTRTTPAWHAVLDLLDNDQWHPRTDVEHAMKTTADLHPTTVRGLLRSASRRGWIRMHRGRIRLRNAHLIEADLETYGGAS